MFYKQKSALLFFVIIANLFTGQAQNFKANDPIAVNQKIKKGVLPNGMTYYIYPTAVNKNTASYYIIQNVGSILENDQQKGLAHFLEHMAFNGTKNFEGKGILNTLQKQGAVFGKNINAYTSTDETVYNLDNIPSKDWSSRYLFIGFTRLVWVFILNQSGNRCRTRCNYRGMAYETKCIAAYLQSACALLLQ